MKSFYITTLLFIISIFGVQSQTSIKATLLDSTTQKTIPYATITLNNSYGVISNNFGKFLINIEKEITPTDSLFISCLGFETRNLAVDNFKDSLVFLSPKTIELNEVSVIKKNYSVNEIIDFAKENLDSNYDLDYSKSKLFYRESFYTKVIKSEIDIKKSTIPEFNQMFMDSIVNSIPKKSDSYTEILGTMYGNITVEDAQKLDIIKSSQLYDKENELTFKSFEEKINTVIKKRVKKDSYFKIKSGIFSTKEEMDSTIFDNDADEQTAAFIDEQNKKEEARKEDFLRYRKQSIAQLEQNSYIFDDTDLNFIVKSNKYKFELLDYAFLNNNYVYKVSFKPKRSAKYKGTLYINPIDFAIVRVDYQNVESLKDFSLLGLSFNQYLHKGTLVYSINNSEKYVLKFAEMEHGMKMGVKRPLKIIEKNKNVKGRRKQNEISAKIHFIITNTTKTELVLFENQQISEEDYNAFKENADTKPTYLPKYDPEFWKGYNVIEPNQAIKDFKSVE